MVCRICGDEKNLTRVIRFWSPDDGWVAGRLCCGCYKDHGKRKPNRDDYAYDRRQRIFDDEDDAISMVYG